MKVKNYLMLSVVAVAVFITGCAEHYTAIYTFPPSEVKTDNISAISPLRIQVSGEFSGNVAINKPAVEALLKQQIASRLYQEGTLKTTDLIWGTPYGGDKVADVFAKYDSAHGYARYVGDEFQCAVLDIKVKARMDNVTTKNTKKYKLYDVPYTRKDANGVPSSKPNYDNATVREVQVDYDAIGTIGKGTIEATLTDKAGKELYKKTFPIEFKQNIKEEAKEAEEKSPAKAIGAAFGDAFKKASQISMGKKKDDTGPHEAPMTANALFERMIVQAVEKLIGDISPHQETREIKFNESGCKMGVLLLKAQAVSEAANYLENYGKMKEADYENLGLAYEILGDYTFAIEAYKQGKCEARIKELEALKARMEGKKADK